MAPFHFWFPNVIEGLNWINNFILITWQKIAPIIVLSFCLSYYLTLFCVILSVFIGAISGLNQTSLRKLMAFSSINHLGWIVRNIINNENLFIIYYLFYRYLSFSIIYIFYNFNIFNLSQIFNLKIKTKIQKFIVRIPLLSLGGLPPFLGFFPKWISIELLILINFYFLIFILINFTLITLYFYIRIIYSSLLITYNTSNWNFSWILINPKNFNFISFIIYSSIIGLFFINFLFFLT
jgi:NADH-ubiquinone oxidoreductase chain 2